MTFLFDVNVLIALFDPDHLNHDVAHRWFEIVGRESWATCVIVENGVIRILSQRYYPNSPGTPADTSKLLSAMRNLPGHQFWPDEIGILDSALIDVQKLLTPGQITDSYLLALAWSHGGFLATFDRRLSVAAAKGGKEALHIIGDHPR